MLPQLRGWWMLPQLSQGGILEGGWCIEGVRGLKLQHTMCWPQTLAMPYAKGPWLRYERSFWAWCTSGGAGLVMLPAAAPESVLVQLG